jgi:hypothetical protein
MTKHEADRPTDQRKARGTWAEPKGIGKHMLPVIDLASDMIGQLFQAKHISSAQEQAARHYQELREAYLAELPEVRGYKSCIAMSAPGHDESDGDPQTIAAYRSMERKLSFAQRRELTRVCDMNEKPRNLDFLRSALDAIGG